MKRFETIFDVLMPGQTRTTNYKIVVDAENPVDAMSKCMTEWKSRTEPRDVRVKEIPMVTTNE